VGDHRKGKGEVQKEAAFRDASTQPPAIATSYTHNQDLEFCNLLVLSGQVFALCDSERGHRVFLQVITS